MTRQATDRGGHVLCALVTCALLPACKRADPGPDLQIVGETLRLRAQDPVPATSPWFDGRRISLVAAQGEVLGMQVLHRGGGPVALTLPGAEVAGFEVQRVAVTRPSTAMYGGSRGAGEYPDELVPAAQPATDPAYFTIRAASDAHGELVVAGRHIPVDLHVAPVVLPALPLDVWGYYDPRELGGSLDAPNDAERACIAMFAQHGVLLSPDMPPSAWAARKDLVPTKYVPAVIPEDPAEVAEPVRAWLAQAPDRDVFAIQIDEPHGPEARAKVAALAKAVRDAGAGKFLYAVTDTPHPEYGDLIDLYISAKAAHLEGDAHRRWTYNGTPPEAGAMVVDAAAPGTRTWGWIAYRYRIPVWYVWDALYWHDRHNRPKGKGEPARALDAGRDAASFDDGDDHGNLDGVLALPGCHPTLRLEALRRGYEDRELLELAEKCHPAEARALAAKLVPRALGDAKGAPAWPADEAAWEAARRQLLELAACSGR